MANNKKKKIRTSVMWKEKCGFFFCYQLCSPSRYLLFFILSRDQFYIFPLEHKILITYVQKFQFLTSYFLGQTSSVLLISFLFLFFPLRYHGEQMAHFIFLVFIFFKKTACVLGRTIEVKLLTLLANFIE